jgi:hypothetical protein
MNKLNETREQGRREASYGPEQKERECVETEAKCCPIGGRDKQMGTETAKQQKNNEKQRRSSVSVLRRTTLAQQDCQVKWRSGSQRLDDIGTVSVLVYGRRVGTVRYGTVRYGSAVDICSAVFEFSFDGHHPCRLG